MNADEDQVDEFDDSPLDEVEDAAKDKVDPYLFVVGQEPEEGDEILCLFTRKSFFEAKGHLDDQARCPKRWKNWSDSMEAMAEWRNRRSPVTLAEAHADMVANGAVFSPELADYLSRDGSDMAIYRPDGQ